MLRLIYTFRVATLLRPIHHQPGHLWDVLGIHSHCGKPMQSLGEHINYKIAHESRLNLGHSSCGTTSCIFILPSGDWPVLSLHSQHGFYTRHWTSCPDCASISSHLLLDVQRSSLYIMSSNAMAGFYTCWLCLRNNFFNFVPDSLDFDPVIWPIQFWS